MPNVNTVKATIDGQEHILTLNSESGKYEAVITAPATSSYNETGHYYNVSITATDTAGNISTIDASDSEFGDQLKLVVKEKVKPIITVVSPSNGATITTNQPEVTVDVTDDDSGVDTSTFSLQIGEVSYDWAACTTESISGGYRVKCTPTTALQDGLNTITVTVSDHDGNAADTETVQVTVDTTPPVLNVSSPTDGIYQNTLTGTVAGTTNDSTSSPVTVTITVNEVDAGEVTVDDSGNFTKQVTYQEGDNTIVVTATDSAGKSSTVTRTVHVNTVAPEFQSVTIQPNPVDAGKTYTITVEVS